MGRCESRFFIAVLGGLLLPLAAVHSGFLTRLTLERAFPASQMVDMEELRARDRARHGRMLEGSAGVVDFPVFGSADRRTFGLYFTKVKLGSPPREFNVQIDTGSDILWVSCTPCNGCPKSSGFGIPLGYFDLDSSSSASLVSCSDQVCVTAAVQITESSCSSQNSQCVYSLHYQDGSGASGYYVSDKLFIDTVNEEPLTGNSSASIIFGCSNYLYGDLSESITAVDGIFGFGQHDLSVISQLSSRGMIPKVFSHCLKGDDNGGGTLVLGEILEPGLIYSPFVQRQAHYNLNLQSIAINGQILPIDSAVLASSNQNTMVDSGTTLAYLTEEVYDSFLNTLTVAVSQSAKSVLLGDDQCFQFSGSVDVIFPSVSLNFESSASMILRPKDYLIPLINNADDNVPWCIGFQKGQSMTVLGDLVLKDKIIVYDLARQRLGWVDYDCSMSINVSVSNKDEYVDTGELSVSSSSKDAIYQLVSTTVSFLAYITMFSWKDQKH